MPDNNGGWGGGTVNYPATEIQVLEGFQAIRKRPRMYVGDLDDPQTPTKMLQGALCEALVDACEGTCTELCIVVNRNGSWGVSQDNPWSVEIVEKATKAKGRNVHKAELIMTEIYACRDSKPEDQKRRCDVGLAALTALSVEASIIVAKDGYEWHQKYEKGVPQPWSVGPGDSKQGTYIWFKLDESLLPQREVDFDKFLDWLKVERPAGLKVTARDERVGRIVELP